ncbi:hypothetical protein EMEDMD4_440188 [Sinorhizobium medicae]|uniref:Uncharacterized protein n=1 Tax=Sinorhizobium medicae TaxID=110321 RepID=A0A508WZD4_9HYPH|nr:hypothetical protein EMEDMD4_440188 [Sinorhizobium medicae]
MRRLLHRLRFGARLFDRHLGNQPIRLSLREVAHMFAPDKRDPIAETGDVQVDQSLAVMALLLGHILENPGGMRIFPTQCIGIGKIDAAIILLRGYGERKYFLLAQGQERTFGTGEKPGEHQETFFRTILKNKDLVNKRQGRGQMEPPCSKREVERLLLLDVIPLSIRDVVADDRRRIT